MSCNIDCFNCTYDDCIDNRTRYDSQIIYNGTDACRESQRKYRQSEKGKIVEQRKTQKKIASGRNAENCRRYRERKKLILLEKEKKNGKAKQRV